MQTLLLQVATPDEASTPLAVGSRTSSQPNHGNQPKNLYKIQIEKQARKQIKKQIAHAIPPQT
jgi:hypothetical protein